MPVRMMAFALLAMTMLGCYSDSQEGTTVTGTVTLDGQPLPRGQVVFEPENTTVQLFGGIDNGKYSVTGVPVGKVHAAVKTKMFEQMNRAHDKFAMKAGSKADKVALVHVPSRYEEVRSANLGYTVTRDAVIDIELKK